MSPKNKKLEFGINENKKEKNLVYTVNPLPHSLLNYVIDFGELSKIDTEKYIYRMLQNEINFLCEDELFKKAVNTVKECHLFIKEKGDISGVSLRDIKYFIIFFRSFIKYYKYLKFISFNQKQNPSYIYINNPNTRHLTEISKMPDKSFKEHAINLSLYISYYLRLPTKELRKELCQILNKSFQYNDFLLIPEKETKYILDQIEINPQRGIAKNNALRENIFCELFCLINKIPLIICGKPGNSKTLSVQLLLDNMKGKSSMNDFFKNPDFKEVITYPFQGSTTCTSKGVQKTFNKARNFSKKNNDMMSLVFFDEMGLAEDSPENPLKVLHAELEKEEDKVAFLGLSNWTLDASKMNRVIRNCVQDPDEEDLILTGKEIAKSVDENNIFKDYEDLIQILARTYFEYRNKKSLTGFKDFHGNRDFYHLIKDVMKYLKENKNENKNDINYIKTITGIKALEKNFGGYENSVNDIINIFYNISKYNKIDHRYDIIKRINDNFKDQNSRYLLLITKNSTSQNLVKQIIQKEKKQNVTYIGSQFKGDKSESYTEEILYKIQTQMKNEVILILKDLEIIYPSLYDLFNQNFSEFNGNKCAKISFANNQSTSLINNKFKIVVLVDENMIKYEDKPFLNRFEKHIISFENILMPKYINIIKNINKKLGDLIKNDNNITINLEKQLISCDKDIIENLVFDFLNKENEDINISEKDLEEKIFELLAPTLTQDIILCSNLNGFITKEPLIYEVIKSSYNKSHANNIIQYLNKISETKTLRHIIYTFSNITEPIFKGNEIKIRNSISSFNSNNSNDSGDSFFNKNNTTEIVIDSIEKSKELELQIERFYKGKKSLCIIKFEEQDLNKMNYTKNIIDNLENFEIMNNDINKYFVFIVYMKRDFILNNEKYKASKIINKNNRIIKDQIPLNADIKQITIDNLNNHNISYNIFDLITNNDKIDNIININKIIEENIYSCIDQFNLQFKNKDNNFNKNYYKEKISEAIKKDQYLSKIMNKILLKNCTKIIDIITNLLTNEDKIHNDDIDLLSVIDQQFKTEAKLTLKKAFYILEQNQILSSYVFNKNIIYERIIDSFIDNSNFNDTTIIMKLNITLGLKIPTIKKNILKMKNYIKKNILEKYIKNENMLRNDLPDENELKWKEEYRKQKSLLEQNTKNQIFKIKGLDDILRLNDNSVINDFFNDLYIIYLSDNYPSISESMIKFLDKIVQIYLLDTTKLKNENNFGANFSEKLFNKYKNEIMEKKYDNYYEDIIKVFLFLETYSDFIKYLIDIYSDIYKLTPKIESEFIESFTRESFVYEKGERSPEYYAEVNIKLFKTYESMIFSMKRILYYFYKEEEKLIEYIQFIKTQMVKLRQLNSEYSFFSKEIFILQNLIFILHSSEKRDKKIDNSDLIIISQFFDKERDYINQNNQKELLQNLINISNILSKNLGENTEDYAKLFVNILLNEYKIFESVQHRLEILKIICSNRNNLIKNSIPIFEYLFGRLEPKEKINDDNNKGDSFIEIFTKEYVGDAYNIIYEFIDKKENDVLKHVLLYLFECKIEKYFFKLKEKYYKTDKNKYLKIIFNLSAFSYFKKAKGNNNFNSNTRK